MEEVTSFQYEMDVQVRIDMGGFTIEVPISVAGEFEAPDRSQAAMSITLLGGLTIESDFVAIGDTTYVKDSESGEWGLGSSEEVLRPDELLRVKLSDIRDLTMVGEEALDGSPVYHLRGVASPGTFTGQEVGLQIEYWIGLEDARIRQVAVQGEFGIEE